MVSGCSVSGIMMPFVLVSLAVLDFHDLRYVYSHNTSGFEKVIDEVIVPAPSAEYEGGQVERQEELLREDKIINANLP